MKNTRKGFTLVELLAVIVILAIIMIIAIPAVLSTMQTAKQKSFLEYTTKVYTAAQNKYMEEKATNAEGTKRVEVTGVTGYTCYNYDIKTALGLTSTGNYIGNVVICEKDSAASAGIEILVRLADDSFYTIGSKETAITGTNGPSLGLWNYTKLNAPEAVNVKTGKIDSFSTITGAAVTAALAQTK